MLATFPQRTFSLEFPEILSQNLIRYHWLSVHVWEFRTMHCGKYTRCRGYAILMQFVEWKSNSLLTLAGFRDKLCDFFCSCFCDVASSIILWSDSIDVGLQVDADFLYNKTMRCLWARILWHIAAHQNSESKHFLSLAHYVAHCAVLKSGR